MPRLFISYRRNDNPYAAHLVHQCLSSRFGADAIFFDVSTLDGGDYFKDRIREAVNRSAAIVVVIGKKWVRESADRPSRLKDSRDFVRYEISTAFESGVPIIPVLIDDASPCPAFELPEELQFIPELNHIHLNTGTDFQSSLQRLIDSVDESAPFIPDWAAEHGRDEIGYWVVLRLEQTTHRFRWIPPGSFHMGSLVDEADRSENERQIMVRMNSGFWLGETVVTQEFWIEVVGDNPSRFDGANHPVDSVSWNSINDQFLKKLNRIAPCHSFNLPSEAQWEYACRATTTTAYSFGASICSENANYGQAKVRSTEDVYGYQPNQWGLYQMHGNVWEWCYDGLRDYGNVESVDDPLGPLGNKRVLKGGCFGRGPRYLRAAFRNESLRGDAFETYGFRLCHP
jgi:hypothetical protein